MSQIHTITLTGEEAKKIIRVLARRQEDEEICCIFWNKIVCDKYHKDQVDA